jgi:hypothetical protein
MGFSSYLPPPISASTANRRRGTAQQAIKTIEASITIFFL